MNMHPMPQLMQTTEHRNSMPMPYNALGMMPMGMPMGFPFSYGPTMIPPAPTKKSKDSSKEKKSKKDESSEDEEATPQELQMVVAAIHTMQEDGSNKVSDGFTIATLKNYIKKLANYTEHDKNFDIADTLFVVDDLMEKHVVGKMAKEDGKPQRYKLKGSMTQLFNTLRTLGEQCKKELKKKHCEVTPTGIKCHKAPYAWPTAGPKPRKAKAPAKPHTFAMAWPFPTPTMPHMPAQIPTAVPTPGFAAIPTPGFSLVK